MSNRQMTWTNLPVGVGHGQGLAHRGPSGLGGFSSSVPRRRRYKLCRDNIRGVTNPAIRRLARRGGIQRIRYEIYNDVRAVLKDWLSDVLKHICHVVEHGRRKTITSTDVVWVLNRRGTPIYGFDRSKVQHRSGRH
ncbi:hypothetical protein GJ744_002319 [Endocarpon pusillum]|uniref:Histone H4 n=1 Tax=Endocarpon pusillum TaxID=364733 RepID=A0A8H7E7I2_9EURO|nr:hypothetical protein GJ744_002319 [Endocarpon pusillum]